MKRLLLVLVLLAAAIAALLVLWPARPPGSESAPARVDRPPGGSLSAERPPPVPQSSLGLEGWVVDARGEPIAGAEVALATEGAETLAGERCDRVFCQRPLIECDCGAAPQRIARLVVHRQGELLPERTARTGAAGEFTFAGPTPARMMLWASAPGHGPARRSGVEAGSRVELQLSEGRPLRGRVVDEQSRPVPGALVTAVPLSLPRFVETTSSADGSFLLEDLSDGPLHLAASAPGFLPIGLALASPTLPSPTLVLARPRTLEGKVLLDGAPAETASVRVLGRDRDLALVSAGGGFRAEELPPGRYTVSASIPGYSASAEVRLVEALTRVELRLRTALEVRGRVIDEADAPIAGVAIVASLGNRRLDDTISDAQGRFALLGIPEGATLVATSPGHEPAEARVEAAGAGEIELLLLARIEVSGTVVSAEGTPLADIQVLTRGVAEAVAMSDAAGAFRLSLPVSGPVTVMAHHSSFGAGEISVEAPARGVRLELSASGGVRARLVDAAGAPVTAGRAMAWRDDETLRTRDTYSTDVPSTEEGWVTLAGLPEGPHRVLFTARGFLPTERGGVAIPAKGLVDLGEVRLEAGEQLSGQVLRADDTPAAAAWVFARPKSGGRGERVAAGQDGQFSLVGLEPGPYTVTAVLEESSGEASAHSGDSGVTIRLGPATRLRGRVLDGSGRPVTRFFVNETPVEAADGRFEVPTRAVRERVLFRIGADGKLTAFRQAAIGSDGLAEAGDIVLEEATAIEGLVLDERGAPVAGASVSTSDGAGGGLRAALGGAATATVVTRADGRFRLEGLTPGPTTIQARRGRQLAEQTVVVPAEGGLPEIVLRLEARGAIEGFVRGADGGPARAQIQSRALSTTSDGAGRYKLDGLAPGRHLVVVIFEAAGDGVLTRDVDVIAGQTARLDIDLAGGGGLRLSITGTAEGTAHLLSTRELSNQTQASWPQIQMSPVIAGVATFTGLKAGRYSFAVYGDNDTEATGEVDLVDGQVIRLDVTTRPRSHTGPQVVPEPEPSVDPF